MNRALLSFVLAVGATAPAAAQDVPVAGSVRAHLLASPQEDLGGAITTDLWYPLDWFRVGGFVGVAAVPAEDDVRNRIFMPLGVSVAVEFSGDDVGVSLRARGGLWGGATQEVKLTAGGFVSAAAYFLLALGPGVALDIGLDVWGVLGDGEQAMFAPGIGLTWNPE